MAVESDKDSTICNQEGGAQGSSLRLVDTDTVTTGDMITDSESMGSAVEMESLLTEENFTEGNTAVSEKSTEPDYYFENGFLVFTGSFLTKRGWCCGNGCRHCPYLPKHQRGNQQLG